MAAGGLGERASTALPKQFVTIAGRPLLVWSFEVLRDGGCHPIVVVAPEEHMERTQRSLSDYRDVVFTVGGAARQDSVRLGLERVDADIVVIHDAARPLAPPSAVRQVVDALVVADGAVVALPVEDTVKQVEGDRVIGTLDRSRLWRSQTPQAFKTDVLRRAHENARSEQVAATDDAELVERIGGHVVVVEGSTRNIKITRGSDIELAELLGRGRQR